MLLPEMIPIYIVNFNTTELTNHAIKTIESNLHAFDYEINIFDNSSARKFKLDEDVKCKVNIIDNTKGQLINFNDVLIDSVDIVDYAKTKKMNTSHFGTLKHAYTIDYIMQNLVKKEFLLFDSDIELLRDIDFIDDKYATIADVNDTEPKWPNRTLPFIQYFNVKKIKDAGIRYFDRDRILFGHKPGNNVRYDTGASFYQDVRRLNLPFKKITHTDYIIHLWGGSFNKDKFKDPVVTIGDYTYGKPTIVGDDSGAKLKIGKFCSISNDAKIFLGLEHRTDWITTYPFSSAIIPTTNNGTIAFPTGQHLEGHYITKGDVTIGNDVWIGDGATIMSGVTIGDGAVIGAKAVVAKDVPPYTIVVGNPMKIVRKRFPDNIIQKMLEIKWWDLSITKIGYLIPFLLSSNFDRFFSEYEKVK